MCVNKFNDLPSALRNLYQNVCQKLAHIERHDFVNQQLLLKNLIQLQLHKM